MTGDGRVDSIDATLSGYTVLSSEETLRLRVVPGSLLWCAMLVPADFDGNGAVDDGCGDGDIGPGRITRPPN
jgi:hypothetical protein